MANPYGVTLTASDITTAMSNFSAIGAVTFVVSAMIGIPLVLKVLKSLRGLVGRR